jgi:CRISPR-associated protein Cas2
MSRFWMIAYDIDDDDIRRKVSNVLKNYGARVQYSVFECQLREQELFDLRSRLLDLIEPEDTLRWYPLCKWCKNAVSWRGRGKPAEDGGFVIA